MTAMLVMIGGGAGALLRFYLERWSVHRFGERVPYGTAIANLLGAAIIGVASGTPFIGTGFCGGLTTFGGFMGQVENRFRHAENRRLSLVYVIAVTIAGIAIVSLTRLLNPR